MDTRPVMLHWVEDSLCALNAVHLACALARSDGTSVILAKMAPVQHVGWLGSEYAYREFTPEERDFITIFEAIGQDYQIEVGILVFQYVTLPEAIVQAAAYIDAQAVFTRLPQHIFAPWRKFLNWNLRRELSDADCEFYNLDDVQSKPNWTPATFIPISKKALSGLHK